MRQSTDFSMEQDDSTMVDDILKELNKAPSTQVNTLPNLQAGPIAQNVHHVNDQQEISPETLRLPLVHPDASILQAGMQQVPKQVLPQIQKPGWFSKIGYTLKVPLVLSLIIFIIFNPITRRILNKYTPSLFNSSSHWRQQLSILLLSVLTGLGFTGLRYIL